MAEDTRAVADSAQGRLGIRVRQLRTERGATQEQLAEAAQLHVTYIASIEAGRRNPSLLSLLAIARGFGVPLSTLVEGVDRAD